MFLKITALLKLWGKVKLIKNINNTSEYLALKIINKKEDDDNDKIKEEINILNIYPRIVLIMLFVLKVFLKQILNIILLWNI